MKYLLSIFFAYVLFSAPGLSQENRVDINGQQRFISGLNMAWGNFAHDLSNFQDTLFINALDDISSAGGNCMRWWIHVNGTSTPTFKDGKVVGISQSEIAVIKKVLDLALERNVSISLCLWSFDMLQDNQGVSYKQNRDLIEDKACTQAYINNALIPMVKSVKGHPAILCWEIFNEPAGMSKKYGWTPKKERTEMKYIQQFVNLAAGAIRRTDPDVKISNGNWSFKTSSDVNGYKNYYTDAALIAAGGDSLGILDFYMVHYYDWGGEALSPFHHKASYWQLDKPIVIAEFSAIGPIEGVDIKMAYEKLYQTGYAGAMSWTWTNHDGHGGIKEAGPVMKMMQEKYPNQIMINLK